jgi:hypothetical protein
MFEATRIDAKRLDDGRVWVQFWGENTVFHLFDTLENANESRFGASSCMDTTSRTYWHVMEGHGPFTSQVKLCFGHEKRREPLFLTSRCYNDLVRFLYLSSQDTSSEELTC